MTIRPDRSHLPDDFLVSRDVRSGVVRFTSRRDGRESYRLAQEPGWLFLKVRDHFVSRADVERACYEHAAEELATISEAVNSLYGKRVSAPGTYGTTSAG